MHRREFVKRSRSSRPRGEEEPRRETGEKTALLGAPSFSLSSFFPSFVSKIIGRRLDVQCPRERSRREIQVVREFFCSASPPTNSFLRLMAEIIREILSLSLSLSPSSSPCVTRMTTRLCGAACNNVYLISLLVLSMGVIGDEF